MTPIHVSFGSCWSSRWFTIAHQRRFILARPLHTGQQFHDANGEPF